MQRDDLIKAIDEYSRISNLMPSTICQYAIKNRHHYRRVKSGYFHEEMAKKIIAWIAENPIQEQAAE